VRGAPQRLVVPEVEPGDVGLVLTVHELEWDGGARRWWITAGEGRRYALPRELHNWASGAQYQVRRSIIRLPTVFAFSQQGGHTAARILSMA
jgi:hypothetical protein